MRIKELIKRLVDVMKSNPNGEVYLFRSIDGMPVCFTGFSCDDNNEASLYEIEGDEVA